MKVRYDRKTDTLSLVLRDNVTVVESDEDKPGVILDYDKDGISSHWKYWMHPGVSPMHARLISNWPNSGMRPALRL